jgi:sec-independent protein translocase protein TatC
MMDNELGKITILGYINALRKRLLIAVAALAATTLACSIFIQKLAKLLAEPIGRLTTMVSSNGTENATPFMIISLLNGVILAIPIIVFEILAFAMPGLNPNEHKWIRFIIPKATIFLAERIGFAYFVMLPSALPFFLDFMGIFTIPRPNDYFPFVLSLLFWVGVCFEMPLLMLVLPRFGIKKPKIIIKQRQIELIGSAIIAAVINPTPYQ